MRKFIIGALALVLAGCGGELTTEGEFNGNNVNNSNNVNNVNNQNNVNNANNSNNANNVNNTNNSNNVVVVCGDGVAEGDENCDGNDLKQQDCGALGFDNGVLACDTTTCRFDTSACMGDEPTCGDNFAVGDEVCDGTDLKSETCATQGFDGGTLGCAMNCMMFDPTMCTTCGDGTIEGDEVCDSDQLNGATCMSAGFDQGTISCGNDCQLDTRQCERITCGNGVLDAGEDCEPNLATTTTCADINPFDGGTLSCNANCTWNTGACTDCGNGTVEAGETCDGGDLDGTTCQNLPNATFDGGNLACNATCSDFITTGCTECGNGTREGTEQCDGNDLNNSACDTIGFDGGTLGCNSSCMYDTQACYACGDGNVDPGEQCDGMNVNGMTCADVAPATPAGNLACSNTCQYDTSMCGAANDADNDGVVDAADPAPNDNTICGDSDSDACDDCSIDGMQNPANDGWDPDGDGQCEMQLDYDCMNGAGAATDPYRLESCIMMTLVNQDRALFSMESGNAVAVTWNEDIWGVAKAHSVDMCVRGFFAHTNPDGDSPSDRAMDAGLGFGVAENIAVNLDVQAAQYAFMEEPTCTGHRGNILHPRNYQVGIGYHVCTPAQAPAGYMWDSHHHVTQNFRANFSVGQSAFCQNAATSCEIPPNPPTTAVCPQQLIGFGFCPVPDANTLTGWNCPND